MIIDGWPASSPEHIGIVRMQFFVVSSDCNATSEVSLYAEGESSLTTGIHSHVRANPGRPELDHPRVVPALFDDFGVGVTVLAPQPREQPRPTWLWSMERIALCLVLRISRSCRKFRKTLS